jgi:site-specific DNA-cytosine methylase
MTQPRVLVACEFSGRVRDAFIAKGCDAWSCDLLPSEAPGNHLQCPVEDVLDKGWDLMVAHPPCTHLAVSGARWFKDKQVEQAAALDFVRLLLNAPIHRIALENPVSIISSRIRKPTQVIHPWMFGHAEAKATCLWLKNLPTLVPTDVVSKPASGHWDNQTPSGQNKLGPSPDRWKERSRTYQGIADAMADQWTETLMQPESTDAQARELCAHLE